MSEPIQSEPRNENAREDRRMPRWGARGVSVVGVAAGLGAAAILGIGFLAYSWTPKAATLLATPGVDEPGVDSDGDGLPDKLEAQFGSSPMAVDTDGDGACDLLELIVGTPPYDPLDKPSPLQFTTPSTRAVGYLEGGNFHLVVAVYVPSGGVASVGNIGAILYVPGFSGIANPPVFDLNPLVLAGSIGTQQLPAGASIVTSDSWFPQEVLSAFFDTDGYMQFTIVFSATVGGVPVSSSSLFSTTASYDSNFLSLSYLPVTSGGSGSFRPLQPASLPPDWTNNSACFVTTALVAVEWGSILVLQTVAAECKPLPASLCSAASCNENVGRTLRVLDPCAFGGCR